MCFLLTLQHFDVSPGEGGPCGVGGRGEAESSGHSGSACKHRGAVPFPELRKLTVEEALWVEFLSFPSDSAHGLTAGMQRTHFARIPAHCEEWDINTTQNITTPENKSTGLPNQHVYSVAIILLRYFGNFNKWKGEGSTVLNTALEHLSWHNPIIHTTHTFLDTHTVISSDGL